MESCESYCELSAALKCKAGERTTRNWITKWSDLNRVVTINGYEWRSWKCSGLFVRMRGCTTGGCPLSGDASGKGFSDRKGCRAASATIGARTRRAGMRWRVHGAARAAARRDAPLGLTWRRVATGGHLARRCRSQSIMAAQRIYVRDTRPSRRASRTVIPPMRITRTRTSTRTPIICSTRNMPPPAPCTVPSDNLRRSTVRHIHRYKRN